MKKLRIAIITLSLLFAVDKTFAQGINWFKGSFEEAKAQARKENKKIFLYIATTW